MDSHRDRQPVITLAICGAPAEPCEHDWSGWRDFEEGGFPSSGGEAYCIRCGLGALADTLSRE